MNIGTGLMHTATCGLSFVFNPFGSKRLMTLIYHRVLPEHDFMRPSEPDAQQFSWQMHLLSEHFNPLSLQEAVERLNAGTLPDRAVCVTFDDGYADNAEVALPILQKYQIPATVFVASSFLNGGRMWNDTIIESVRIYPYPQLDLGSFDLGVFDLSGESQKRSSAQDILVAVKHLAPNQRQLVTDHIAGLVEGLPDNLMLDDSQLKELHAAGIEIGGHTNTHPILASLEDEEALNEISSGIRHLESTLNTSVKSFAYPNGRPNIDFHSEHRDFLPELGLSAAVTTEKGVASSHSDPFLLPRHTPWDKVPWKFMVRLLMNTRNVI